MSECISTKLNGNELIIETGKIAKQADGAVTVQFGGTVVLVTCVCSKEPREGIDFLPLTVEYRERTYAAGKIPGGFFKREGRPSEKEILTSRRIDRPIRPLLPKDMINDIQVISIVLSSDGQNDADILALNGASSALSISNIPFEGPVGCVRVGYVNGNYVLNPTFKELENSDLDLVIVGLDGRTIMMESGVNELGEEKIIGAIEFARPHIKTIIDAQRELVKKCGKKKRNDITLMTIKEDLFSKVKELSLGRIKQICKMDLEEEREEALDSLTKELLEKFSSENNETEESEVKGALRKLEKEVVRKIILEEKKRVDDRSFNDIRPIECVVGFLPRTHGSGLFTRGRTQALCATTLGTSADEQMIDALEGEMQKSFMLHYNFPPFSVGEVRALRGPGRREIGHGALAERSLKPVIPPKDKFPYTVRLVSDILESNGSSSMATVCAGSLSLMDSGVPIKASVAGIAIGLIEQDDKDILLTDIAGVEDYFGDMDFKVAGTKNGITAIQLDLKIKGLKEEVLKEALYIAKEARLKVLNKMDEVIPKPKDSVSEYAPMIVNLKVSPDKIKDIIGPGGRTIKKIIRDTGVTIDIEDDGSVQVAASEEEAANKAIDIIQKLSAEVEVGKIYLGKITRITNFGAFCEILPGKEGLIHISEVADKFIKDVSKELKIDEEVLVKVVEIDPQGRINLSRKQALDHEEHKNKS